MTSQSSDNLFRSLGKGDLAPVYYFFGAEDVLKDEAVNQRITWGKRMLMVRQLVDNPRRKDRIVMRCEELRA